MKKVIGLSVLLIGLMSLEVSGQGKSLMDSLKFMLKSPPNDSVETRWVNSLFGLYLSVDMDSALYYGERAKELAAKTQDSVLIASNILNFGGYYWYQSDFTKAMESYVQAAEIFDKLGSETDKADAQINIALIYMIMGEGSKSKPFFYEILDVYKRNSYWNGLSTTYQYLGVIYQDEANYDSAIFCFNHCLDYAIQSKMVANQAWAYSGLGEAYQKKGLYKEARENQLKSLEIEEKLGNRAGMLQSYISIGSLEKQMGNLSSAEAYYTKAEAMPELEKDWISQRNLYQELVKLYETTGEVTKAYANYKKHVAAQDSIKNSEDLATINELNEKYESEKKANEILTLQKDRELDQLTLEKERSQKIFFIGASVLFLILSTGLIYGYSLLRKSKGQLEKRNETITKINRVLNKSQNDLIASNKTKDKFFALVAHDLRGPVTSMQGIGRMLAYYNKKGDEKRINELIDQVDQSATSVNHLLDNLLKWALSQSEGLSYQPATLALKGLIDEIQLIFNEEIKAKEVDLRIQLDGDVQVKADHNMISSVLRNLLSNAIKFSPVGGKVVLALKPNGDTVHVEVADSGGGIPASVIQKLHESQPLQSTRGTQGEKGTGLGLLLCKEFVKIHGSDLSITNDETGARISFELELVYQVHSA